MTDKTPIQFSDDDRQLLRQIAGLVQDMNFRLAAVEENVAALDKRVTALEEKMDKRITSLEEKVDARLHDTRPIWEQVLSELREIKTDAREFKAEMKTSLRDVDRELTNLQLGFARRYADVDERLEKLERESHKN